MKRSFFILILTMSVTLAFSQVFGQTSAKAEKQDVKNRRHSIGSTLFLLGNIGDSVRFIQLNYGYRLSPKDNIIVEAITWTYYEPLGTYLNSEEYYPGKVRATGIGLGYQRFHWKNLYTTVEPTFFLQQFYDSDGIKIQNGFQLYLFGFRF